ncbi:MAG: hypothetical protein AAF934_00615, partial [Bacteroidota bacterium]
GVFFRNDGSYKETVTVGATTEDKYVDAQTNTYTDAANPTALTRLKSLYEYTLDGYSNYKLKSPVTGNNLQLESGTMPFDQQKIFVYPKQKIS